MESGPPVKQCNGAAANFPDWLLGNEQSCLYLGVCVYFHDYVMALSFIKVSGSLVIELYAEMPSFIDW